MTTPAPLIKLEENASAPVLRYDIPEPTSYSGTNLVQLQFTDSQDIFKPSAVEAIAARVVPSTSQPREAIRSEIRAAVLGRVSASSPLIMPGGSMVAAATPQGTNPLSPQNPDPSDPIIDPAIFEDLVEKVSDGYRVVVEGNVNGDKNVTTVPVPPAPEPHLYLVETFRMTTYLGDYGAGRVVKTFSLLPGESTKISIKTFKQRESTSKRASSVLDSVTTESAADLQNSIQQEQSDQRSYQSSKEYFAEVSGSGSWGFGSAEAKAGIKGSTNSAREESVKNLTNATQKHTSKASATRSVDVDTSFEVTEKEGEETSIERTIENLNVSRTLNFVFRQMNQAFITFVHLTDVRIAYFDGRRETRIEVPIAGLDSLLAQVVKPGQAASVRSIVLDQLNGIRDFEGNLVDVIKSVPIGPNDSYDTFDPGLTTDYHDASTDRNFPIPGVILGVNSYVMRTEGVIVEALLGEGVALDSYASALQELEVSRREQEVRALAAKAQQNELLNSLVSQGETAKAELLAKLLHPCCGESTESEE